MADYYLFVTTYVSLYGGTNTCLRYLFTHKSVSVDTDRASFNNFERVEQTTKAMNDLKHDENLVTQPKLTTIKL